MASRDRVRKNEVYGNIEKLLEQDLKRHPGLQEINQRRRKAKLEAHRDEEAPLEAFQRLIDADPTLSGLFGTGERLVSGTGPSKTSTPFVGREFPTYFRLTNEPKDGLVKSCPINRRCRVEFETDAVNDYFERKDNHGWITFDPPNLVEGTELWNGRLEARFVTPWDAKVGDMVKVTVTITDIERENKGAFVSTFTLKATEETGEEPTRPGRPPRPRTPNQNGKHKRPALDLPNIQEIRREDWGRETPPFHKFEAIRIQHTGKGGYDFTLNVDSAFLLTELSNAKEDDKPLIKSWFRNGLVFAAMGMIRHHERIAQAEIAASNNHSREDEVDEGEGPDLEAIGYHCNGLAQVIVSIIKTLSRNLA